jgi:hypothetical protein
VSASALSQSHSSAAMSRHSSTMPLRIQNAAVSSASMIVFGLPTSVLTAPSMPRKEAMCEAGALNTVSGKISGLACAGFCSTS